jgi:hypothetical protein
MYGGSEPILKGIEYRIPFGGIYIKYEDGSKVFKFHGKDTDVRYSAQLHRGIWHVKVEMFLPNKSCLVPVTYFGRDENYKEAFKQVRAEIREHRQAINRLPSLK